MDCILKYSGEDRDYFLTVNQNLKSYEYIVHKFHCRSQSEANRKKAEIFKLFCKLGLIEDPTNGANTSHLRTSNRDAFRMYILKEYGIDMVSIEREMNLRYMSMTEESSSDDYSEKYNVESDDEDGDYSNNRFSDENISEEESEYESDMSNDDLI